METLSEGLGWTNSALAWMSFTWFVAAVVVGGILIARDEWRFHRKKPKPEEVRAYADRLQADYGREASRINGDATYQARLAKDFDRYRFLKAVSGELVSRSIAGSTPE